MLPIPPPPPITMTLPAVDTATIGCVSEWGYDTIAASDRLTHNSNNNNNNKGSGGGGVLYHVGVAVASELRLLGGPDATVDGNTWRRFLLRAEAGYRDTPYHNGVHAADVTQSVFALLHLVRVVVLDAMPPAERLAVVFSAVVHDIGHPGRSTHPPTQSLTRAPTHPNSHSHRQRFPRQDPRSDCNPLQRRVSPREPSRGYRLCAAGYGDRCDGAAK